jgi:hypothetical protein
MLANIIKTSVWVYVCGTLQGQKGRVTMRQLHGSVRK